MEPTPHDMLAQQAIDTMTGTVAGAQVHTTAMQQHLMNNQMIQNANIAMSNATALQASMNTLLVAVTKQAAEGMLSRDSGEAGEALAAVQQFAKLAQSTNPQTGDKPA